MGFDFVKMSSNKDHVVTDDCLKCSLLIDQLTSVHAVRNAAEQEGSERIHCIALL